jgi:hypothetical protein
MPERRIGCIDEDRAGDRVLTLGCRLRTAVHLDARDIPKRNRSEDEFIVRDCASVDDQRGSRPVASEKGGQRLQRSGCVQSANGRTFAASSYLYIGDSRKQVVDPIVSSGFNLSLSKDYHAGRCVAELTSDPFARDDDFGFGGKGRIAVCDYSRLHSGRQDDREHSPTP